MKTHKTPHARSDELMCGWHSWHVSRDGHLTLHMPTDHCCNMAGAVRTATYLMPEVHTIVTFSGDRPDTVYRKESGKWVAYPPLTEAEVLACLARIRANKAAE